jgi:hypothetical protein
MLATEDSREPSILAISDWGSLVLHLDCEKAIDTHLTVVN